MKLKSTSLALAYIMKTIKQSFKDLNPEVCRAVDVELPNLAVQKMMFAK